MNKKHRPHSRAPRNSTAIVKIRLTPAELKDWQRRAKADELTVSQYVRNAMAAYRTDED